jgi:hypothetical protein
MFQLFRSVYFLHGMCQFGVKPMLRKLAVHLAVVLRPLIIFFAVSGIAQGQSLIEVGFGVRGGRLANGESFQGNRFCVDTACGLVSTSFTADKLSGTFGPAVNVLLNDHLEVRLEAVHRRFGYQVHTVVGPGIQQSVETTQGNLWEYPILATYHFSSGPVRPFAGGGLSLVLTGTRSTETASTTTIPTPTTSLVRTSGSLANGTLPFYLVAGIDSRISHVSIRPEFRYSHFPVDQNAEVILKPNQIEFLLGVSVQFRLKKMESHR